MHDIFDIVMLSETHVPTLEVDRAEQKVQQLGCKGFWTPAEPTGRGGTSGGLQF